MANGWRSGGEKVATDGRTVRDGTRRTTAAKAAGAKAPSEEQAKATSVTARDVVIAYIEARCRAGLTTDQRTRAILGKYARKLIQEGGWDRATIIEAAERFATSRRHVRFFHEFVASVFNADQLAEHAKRKAEEAKERTVTRGLSPLGDILRRAAAVSSGGNRGDASHLSRNRNG